MKYFFTTLLTLASVLVFGQSPVPQGINYQAVIRNPTTGSILTNSVVSMQFELFNSMSATTATYTETKVFITNVAGIITHTIGFGVPTGGTLFSNVNWKGTDVWYQVSIDVSGGTSYSPVGGRQKFMTVPYAFYANDVKVSNSAGVLTIGSTTVPLTSSTTSLVAGSNVTITPSPSSSYTIGVPIKRSTVGDTLTIGTYTVLNQNGIYSGSGSLTQTLTTVNVGTNALIVSANGIDDAIRFQNTYNGAITDFVNTNYANNAYIDIFSYRGSGAYNPSGIKFKNVSFTPPLGKSEYGSIFGSLNGVTLTGGATYTNALTTSTLGDVWLNAMPTSTVSEGRLVINHTSTASYPAIHLKSTGTGTNNINRIKFSSTTAPANYFETTSDNRIMDDSSTYKINYYDGTNLKSIFHIYGNRRVSINALGKPLSGFHVMTNTLMPQGGIISEGFAQAGIISIARNNSGSGSRTAVLIGNELGRLTFAGSNGSPVGMKDGASIRAEASENFGSVSNGSDLIFSTVKTGSTTLTDQMSITSEGTVQIWTSLNINTTASLTIPNGAGTGKVLTSDALGFATWQTPAAAMITGTLNAIPFWNTTTTLASSVMSQNIGGGILMSAASTGSASPRLKVKSDGSYIFMAEDMSSTHTFGIHSEIGPISVDGIYLGTVSNSDLHFSTNNIINPSVMVLKKSSNRLGIGNATPVAKLDVFSNSPSEIGFKLETGTTSTTTAMSSTQNGTGDGFSTYATSARALFASNGGSSLLPTIEATGGSVEIIKAYKGIGAIGTVASFANPTILNTSDVVVIDNSGSGAGLRLNSTSTSTVGLHINNGHIKASGATPTWTAALLTLSSVTLTGSDVAGTVTFNAFVAISGSSNIINVIFNKKYSSLPVIILTPTNATAAGIQVYVEPLPTFNGFTIKSVSSLVAGNTYSFNYFVIE